MKRSKYSEEPVVYALRQAERGTPVGDVCRQLGISEATFYQWKKMLAHLGVAELRRMRRRPTGGGWSTCPTKSVKATEIEAFVVDQVRGLRSGLSI